MSIKDSLSPVEYVKELNLAWWLNIGGGSFIQNQEIPEGISSLSPEYGSFNILSDQISLKCNLLLRCKKGTNPT